MARKKIKISELKEFDIAEHLDDPEMVAEYLSDAMEIALEKDDPTILMTAFGDVARAKGVAQIAKKAGVGRESLYKSLKEGARPRFDTMMRVLNSMDMKVSITAKKPEKEAA